MCTTCGDRDHISISDPRRVPYGDSFRHELPYTTGNNFRLFCFVPRSVLYFFNNFRSLIRYKYISSVFEPVNAYGVHFE